MSQDTSCLGGYKTRITYPYQWLPQQKHCGGMTKCGKACHKGVNLVILKWIGDKIKAYCKECDEFIEEAEVSKECHD